MASVVRVQALRYSVSGPDGPVEIIDIPGFSVESGDRVVLHGPSGCGKTTFLHLLSGLLVPGSGELEVAGERLDRLSERLRDAFRARHVGYVFQSFNLLPALSALENVLLPMSLAGVPADRGYAESLLAEVDLKHRLHHRPAQLSIGEQQRVAVARALAVKPSLLLADEPTGSLDERRSTEIMTLLEGAVSRHGCALIAVSHDPAVMSRFPRRVEFAGLNQAYGRSGPDSAGGAS